MRRLVLTLALAVLAAPAAAQDAAPFKLDLTCKGVLDTSERERTSLSLADTYNPMNSASGSATTERSVKVPLEVQVALDGAQGRLRDVGAFKPEWRQIEELTVGESAIEGRYRHNAMVKPRLRIDRGTGQIKILSWPVLIAGSCEVAPQGFDARKF